MHGSAGGALEVGAGGCACLAALRDVPCLLRRPPLCSRLPPRLLVPGTLHPAHLTFPCPAVLCSEVTDASEGSPTHGPASPTFQLCLLGTLQRCLPRVRRRRLHFLADSLHMQLRWAAEMLPRLPLRDAFNKGNAPAEEPLEGQQPLTVAAAVRSLASMAGGIAAWADGQLAGQERHAALGLQGAVLLQLAGLCLQLPQALQAAAGAVEAAQQQQPGGGGAGGAAPAAGSRLPLMRAAHTTLLELPQVLIAAAAGQGAQPGSGTSPASSPEHMLELAEGLGEQLAAAGLNAAEFVHFSATEAAEGAAAAACAAACSGSAGAAQQAQRLRELPPAAASLLLDLGAQHQSVPLTLLPLCALCTACSQLGRSAGEQPPAAAAEAAAAPGPAADARLAASSPALDRLLSALVAVMSHNPVQLLRSCAHDALHAVLDAFAPRARLEVLRRLVQVGRWIEGSLALVRCLLPWLWVLPRWGAADVAVGVALACLAASPRPPRRCYDSCPGMCSACMKGGPPSLCPAVQSPSTAAAVVALQRLRQEMAAAWLPAGGTPAGTAGAPAAPASPLAAAASSGADAGVWLSSEALGLALPCLERGSEGGWHDEASVLAAADVQAAALSLLRWVLLRERAAPLGLVPSERAAALLARDLLPLQACVGRLLQLQAAQGAGGASGSSGSSGERAAAERQRLDGYLAVQRLHEALGCVIELLQAKV